MRGRIRATSNEERATIIWHDVECGSYEADVPLWEELAAHAGGPVLELGCGTGRVALHLARRGHEVIGLDTDPGLITAFRDRAAAEGLPARAESGDARDFSLQQRFALVLAPMQLIQVLCGPAARMSCLRAVARHLRPGGMAALSLVEGEATGSPFSAPIPDVREQDGWVYSSLPLGVGTEDGALLVERLRQTVSPDGDLHEEPDRVRLQVLSADQLEREARAADLRTAGRRSIEATELHLGSTVVLLEA